MSSITSEYRDRLHATQRNRRSRKAESRRNSGPVDVDDFYIPESSLRQSLSNCRSQTPQPILYSAVTHKQQQLHGDTNNKRRYQSAPRSSMLEKQSTRQAPIHGESSTSCLQSGRRGLTTEHIRPPRTHKTDDKRKSLSQFQLNDKIFNGAEALHKNYESSSRQQQTKVRYRFEDDRIDDDRIDQHINSKIDTGMRNLSPTTKDNARSKSITAIDNPRLYAASYYAKKVGVSTVHDGDNSISDDHSTNHKAKHTHTHQSIQRSVSQKMADCLLPSKSSYNDEVNLNESSKLKKKKGSSSALASFCFVDNFLDVTQDSIDITTIDIHSPDNRNPNISVLHDNSPTRSGNLKQKTINNTNRTATKVNNRKLYEDNSTNQTTTATSSYSSDNDEDCTDTAASEYPPKVLNVRKIHNTSLPHHEVIQVNPDDYDFSYRNRKNNEPIISRDISDVRSDATVDIEPYIVTPPRPASQQQRDLQRRPRGIFEHVTSNDEDEDNIDDVITSSSTPYDESTAQAQNDTLQKKFNQALQEIEQQRVSILNLENQLKATKLELATEKSNVKHAIDEATERSRTYADATTKIVQERIDSDDRLLREKEANKVLRDEIECLKREVINLSVELERAVHRKSWDAFHFHPGSSTAAANNSLADDLSATSNKSDSNPEKALAETAVKAPPTSTETNAIVEEATKSLAFMSEKLQASQKETADLQSQLSAMRAANELHIIQSEQLQVERDDAMRQKAFWQKEMLQAKAKLEEMDNQNSLYQTEMLQTTKLEKEVESLKKELDFSKLRASDYATNIHQLEQELIRAQLDAAKQEIRASSLEKELREYRNLTSTVLSLPGPPLTAYNEALDINGQCTNLETSRIESEQMKERQQMENELTQRLFPNTQHSVSRSKSDAGELHSLNLVNRYSNNTVQRETSRGSADLLDILRKKLNS